MGCFTSISVIILYSCVQVSVGEIRTETKCSPEDLACEHQLTLSNSWTMMHFTSSGIMLPVMVDQNGTFYARSKSCEDMIPLTEEEISQVIIGDGTQKPVLVFNHQLPGPSIVVYEGQQVVVKVTNEMVGAVTTVHWHGQTMEGTPYMDGVASVSQCPIHPGETFTYRFRASKVGTHWYHTHLGTQRSMGAYGPLIVLPKPQEDIRISQEGSTDDYTEDFIMMVSDWMHEDTETITSRLEHDNLMYAYGFNKEECYTMSTQVDGLEMGVVPFKSGLVNGRGRHYPEASKEALNPQIPVEKFTIGRNASSKIRFRLISASMLYALRVSIDSHDLHVLATDGHDIDPVTVQAIIVQPGERYDFWLEARDPTLAGRYWIRVTTLEYEQKGKKIMPGHTEAVLDYSDDKRPEAEPREPVSTETQCTEIHPCYILNCPFENYPAEFHSQCIDISQLRSRHNQPVIAPAHEDDMVEIFLNFHFSGMNSIKMFRPNINGKVFVPPDRPLQLQSRLGDAESTACASEECAADVCYCTHQLDIPLNRVIQMVIFTAMPQLDESHITGTPHPIHIHGHQLEVIKVAYPTYNQTTGKFQNFTGDIFCKSNSLCNEATWSDPSWSNGNIPGGLTNAAPRKDTLSIPGGGYVVVRFRSDNPGYWIMHCHMEVHNELGMALVIKEGEPEDMPSLPASLTNTCGPTEFSEQEFTALLTGQNIQPLNTGMNASQSTLLEPVSCQDKQLDYKVLIVILGAVDFSLVVGLLSLIYQCKKSSGAKNADQIIYKSSYRECSRASHTGHGPNENVVLLS